MDTDDVIGYGKAIETFDNQLPSLIENLKKDDLLLITADHGNDPTYAGTDHTREYVPLLHILNHLQIRRTFQSLIHLQIYIRFAITLCHKAKIW